MSDYVGNIALPEIAASGVFPLVADIPYGVAISPEVAVHQFGSANAKIEQRYLLGTGAKRFLIRKSYLRDSDRLALRNFWEAQYGPYGAFFYDAPNPDGTATRHTCRFENEPLSWEMLSDAVCSVGLTLVEIPASSPTYQLNQTVTRFPTAALSTALLAQAQELIPLVVIEPRQSGYPAIRLSDRRCTIGAQLYQARLLEFDGISQSLGGESDQATFTFGNADRVMRDLANDVDLFRASVEFSLFHVALGVKLDLWKGEIVDWSMDAGPEFRVAAADGLYELNLPYPTRKISRTCWKDWNDGRGCPAAQAGGTNLAVPCDKGFATPAGCQFHNMTPYFGGIIAQPQAVRIKDNSTGTWGFGRSAITSVSLVADSIYDEVVPEIYTDSPLPVNCKIAAGREESEFYNALGIVGEGPLGGFGSGHKLDNQPNHGPGNLGLRTSLGNDPNPDPFSLGEGSPARYGAERAAGTAFIEIRRNDQKGFQPSRLSEHSMEAVVALGLRGWVWSAPGVRFEQVLTNPVWIAVNMVLRARGLRNADAATCEKHFDVTAAIAAASICNEQVTPLVRRFEDVWIEDPEHPDGGYMDRQEMTTETQFKFRGIIQEEKPLRDWIQEVLMNCLGYFTHSFGKLKIGLRANSSAMEAFTPGNILFQSLRLEPARPGFNHLTANFADEEFEYVANSVTVYDIDHAKLIGGATSPLYLKSSMNLAGSSSKSQAARLLSVRLREELGGITPDEWKRARNVSFRTTVLALATEPGMVCSMTHPDMPAGAGEFRVTGWRLNRDYSIEIQGRTTTDSMYDLTVGPKPADVAADPVPGEPYYDPAPDVLLFKAGKSAGDGTFAQKMYWDDRRQRMLIDWACVLPEERTNWSGVQVWIKSPDASGGFRYTRATPVLTREAFRESADGTFFLYDTIAVEPASVPDPPQSWVVVACSINRFGQANLDTNGNPTGPITTLQTLGRSDYVSNFTVTIVREFTEGGQQMFRLAGSWTNPEEPRYKGVRIVMRNWEANDIPISDEPEGATGFQMDAWPVPDPARTVKVFAVPIYGDNTVAPIVEGTTPMVELTIARLAGTPGQEYALNVVGLTATLANPAYATNGQGQKVLRVDLAWNKPADPRYGGVVLGWIRGGISTIFTGVEPGVSLRMETTYFPAAAEPMHFYALSVDTNNRQNTYVEGVTPKVAFTLPAPTLGPAGAEYTPNVTNFSAAVSYPSMADGTAKALVTCYFTKPSDATWGGLEILVDGLSMAKGTVSPLTFEYPVTIFQQTQTLYAVSHDVNGKSNTIVIGVTPVAYIIVGNASGQLDLTKAKATSYDPNIFTITDGKFRVWAMDGSLIVTGTISSAKLNATEIMVGGGGAKPGKFGVYNASGQRIGFIGVDGSYEGGHFRTLGVGGSDFASAFLKAINGTVTLENSKVSVTGSYGEGSQTAMTAEINPSGNVAPMRVYSPYGEAWIEDGEVTVVSNNPSNRYPLASLLRTSERSRLTLWSGPLSSNGRILLDAEASLAKADIGIPSSDRRVLINIDGGSDPYIDFRNIAVKADGYAGYTGSIAYRKADGANGTLTIRRGLVVAES